MISCLHLDHNEVKLRINKKKETTEKKKKYLATKQHILSEQWVIQEIIEVTKNSQRQINIKNAHPIRTSEIQPKSCLKRKFMAIDTHIKKI